jgi:phosphoadenosine phosphosulfate reductase
MEKNSRQRDISSMHFRPSASSHTAGNGADDAIARAAARAHALFAHGARDAVALKEAAAELDNALQAATPLQIVGAARAAVPERRLAVTSSFGAESALLLKYVADVDPAIPVLFLDTGWLFEETLAYRDALVARLQLSDVRSLTPDTAEVAERDGERDLWFRNPDACCALRKVAPLAQAMTQFDGWINGRKRFHGNERSNIPVVEADGLRLKFNPLALVAQDELKEAFAQFDLPRHPLEKAGFASIGCMPCTSRVDAGQSVRDGRWAGRGKTECGIHGAADALQKT